MGIFIFPAGLLLTSSTGTANTQSQHLHGHGAVALAAVNVGVIGEDIGHGLRSQVVGQHQRHCE